MQRWLTKFQIPLIALLLLGMGAFFAWMLGQIDTLRCERIVDDRPGGARCAITTTWLNLYTLRSQPLGALHRAGIEDSCDSEGCTYRVYLSTDRGGHALGNVYTSDLNGQQETAARINQFLAGGEPTLEIHAGAGWVMIIPGLMLLAGVIVAAKGFWDLLHPG